MNKPFLYIVAMSLLGCGTGKRNNTDPAPFDENIINSISAKACQGSQKLKEITLTDAQSFNDLPSLAKAFGFYNGEGDCAVKNDIVDLIPTTGNLMMHFEVHPQGACLSNGSLWAVSKIEIITGEIVLTLKSYEDLSQEPTVRASRDLSLIYGRDHAGLRPMKCAD